MIHCPKCNEYVEDELFDEHFCQDSDEPMGEEEDNNATVNTVVQSNYATLYQFVLMNHDYIAKTLFKSLKEKREENLKIVDSIFISDLEEQFIDRARWILTANITARTSIPTDEVISFVEGLNIQELLK